MATTPELSPLEPGDPGFVDPFAGAKDPLGARMKELYEHQQRHYLPRKAWTVIRIDGRAFHAYTQGLEKPFDQALVDAFGETLKALCSEISGAQVGYHQSDELSVIVTDFESERTEPWFGGNVQKMASVSASLATAAFNDLFKHPTRSAPALFDARAFSIPTQVEVANYALWRQQDAYRNAISMIGQANFSTRELHGVSTRQLVEKLKAERGIDVSDFPEQLLRGQVAERVTVLKPVEYFDKRTQTTVVTEPVERRVWELKPAPDFRGLEWLRERLPEPPLSHDPAGEPEHEPEL